MVIIKGKNTFVTFTNYKDKTNPISPDLVYGGQNFLIDNSDTTVYPNINTLTLSASAAFSGNSFSFAKNTITAGNGTDTLYGSMLKLEVKATGSAAAYFTDNNITLKGSTITAGSGKGDKLYGLMDTFSVTADLNGSVGGSYPDHPGVSASQNMFNLGSSVLSVKNGVGDQLIGSVAHVVLSATNGALIGASNDLNGTHASGGNTFNFGIPSDDLIGNILIAEKGSGNLLYGNAIDIKLTASGTTYEPAAIGSLYGDGFNVFNFMGNNLAVVNSKDNKLYGNAQALTLDASHKGIIGSLVNDPASRSGYTESATPDLTFNLGNNLFVAGFKGDTLFGAFEDLTIKATSNAVIQNATLNFGNETFNLSNGDNVIVGDVARMSFTNDGTSLVKDNVINWGDNTFNVGTGNNTIYGNVIDGSGFAAFQADADIPTLDSLLHPLDQDYDYQVFTVSKDQNTLPFINVSPTGAAQLLIEGSIQNSDYVDSQIINDNPLLFAFFPNPTDIAIKATGKFIAPTTGMYTFYTISDDQSALYITDMNTLNPPTLVVGGPDKEHAAELNTGNIQLIQNHTYEIDVTYLQGELYFTLSFGILDPTSHNIINPGTNTYNLPENGGTNTIVLSPVIDMGENIINQWDSKNDTLQFNNIADQAKLESMISSISKDSAGTGTLLTFKPVDSVHADGGTINFTNIAYNGQSVHNWIATHVPHLNFDLHP